MLIYDVLWCFNILLSGFILYFLVEYVGYLEKIYLWGWFGFSKKIRGLDLVRKYVVWI